MQLQDGAGSLGLNGSEEAVLHGLGLVGTVDHQQNPLCLHNAADAHGVGMGGDIFPLFEEALVGIDGGVGQLDLVGVLDEGIGGLVKADVAVGPRPSSCRSAPPKESITAS